jgi:hypothetical protein
MTVKAGYCTPLLHVKSIEESMRFYALLGFETVDKMGEGGCLGWARMHCEGGAVMFLTAEERVDPSKQGVLFALYTANLPGLREHLLANGVNAPAITYPDYMPSGAIHLLDPDGYMVSVNHWGEAEHTKWEKERKTRIAAG